MNIFTRLFTRSPKFRTVASKWLSTNLADCCAEVQYRAHRMFENWVYPDIGDLRVDQIKPTQIVSLAKKLEIQSPSGTRLLLQRLNKFFSYSKAMGWIDHNPAEGLNVVLAPIRKTEFAFLKAKEMPDFLAAICNQKQYNAEVVAFWLIAYTAVRRAEAVNAELAEFDFAEGLWTIPAERMKRRRAHIVPLSSQTINLLKNWIQNRKNLGVNGNRLFGDMPLHRPIEVIRKSGYELKMTLHGFRKVFSTHAHESGLWTIDAIELQLSHAIQGVRGVYNKAYLLDERRKLMQWYAEEIEEWKKIGCDN